MSSTTTSSTSSLLLPKSRHTTPKDYESAFGNLSSQYGFGGGIPSLPWKSSKSTKSTKPSSSSTPKSSTTTTQSTSSRTQPQKDYESAFGQLSSSYGYGGGFSLPTRQ